MKKAREAERAPPVAARAPGQREKGRGVGPAAELQLRPAQLREQPRQALDGPALVAEARDPDRAPAAAMRTTHFEKPRHPAEQGDHGGGLRPALPLDPLRAGPQI